LNLKFFYFILKLHFKKFYKLEFGIEREEKKLKLRVCRKKLSIRKKRRH